VINDLVLINNIDLIFDKKLILYGAGVNGKKTYELLAKAGISISLFCDSDSSKWDESYCGIRIISPNDLKEIDKNNEIAIIITSSQQAYIKQIKTSLEDLNLSSNCIFTLLGLEIAITQNVYNQRINRDNQLLLLQTLELQRRLAIEKRDYFTTLFFINQLNIHSDVLVYQPGKVGSSTLVNSLSLAGINCSHIHFLTKHDSYSEELNQYIDAFCHQYKQLKNKKIITLVRDPLGRSYSGFFQAIGAYGSCNIKPGNTLLDTCYEWLKNEHSDLINRFGDEFDWFDNEIKAVFGVDVFSHPFNKEIGYSIIKHKNFDVLVIKLEKLNNLESIIGDFIGLPCFKLMNANEGEQKLYNNIYKNLKDKLNLPNEILDYYYKNKTRINNFYSDEEISEFIIKWNNQ